MLFKPLMALLAAMLLLGVGAAATSAVQQQQPNVLFIIVDGTWGLHRTQLHEDLCAKPIHWWGGWVAQTSRR